MDEGSKKKGSKSRRELPEGAVATLKAWLLSPEHFTHPYPTPQDQIMLMQKTGIDKKQLKNWFTNARRRIWKPMLKKQLEQGKLATTGAGSAAAAALAQPPQQPSGASAVPVGGESPYSLTQTDGNIHAMQQQYQQTLQQPTHQLYDAYGNPTPPYPGQARPSSNHPGGTARNDQGQQYGQWPQGQGPGQQYGQPGMAQSNSIGSLPPIGPSGGSTGNVSQMNKTDSHAVLMELFARDQDLVRQATEGAKLKAQAAMGGSGSGLSGVAGPSGAAACDGQDGTGDARQQEGGGQGFPSQHPMMTSSGSGSSGAVTKMGSAPSFNSWPHFSSVSSLNNLGTMTGVKSITNMSGADLVSQGSLNKKGNLAQVKSIESMGRADSYAFLEVFFEDRGSGGSTGAGNLVGGGGGGGGGGNGASVNSGDSTGPTSGILSEQSQQKQHQRGVKREREEESDDIGLSLDGPDESPSVAVNPAVLNGDDNGKGRPSNGGFDGKDNEGTAPLPLGSSGPEMEETVSDHNGNLKRAYDDALAARGLISVRRSCEKLTDLALPAKMQRTLSQEFLRQQMNPVAASVRNPSLSGGDFASSNSDINQVASQTPSDHAGTSGGHTLEGEAMHGEQSAGQPPSQDGGSFTRKECDAKDASAMAGAGTSSGAVQGSSVNVPATTKCALCRCINVDTQLRPCGHMFHGRCLKPSLQNALGPPQCPIDHIAMQSAVLAIPTQEGRGMEQQ